jgi:hypothetical protein
VLASSLSHAVPPGSNTRNLIPLRIFMTRLTPENNFRAK